MCVCVCVCVCVCLKSKEEGDTNLRCRWSLGQNMKSPSAHYISQRLKSSETIDHHFGHCRLSSLWSDQLEFSKVRWFKSMGEHTYKCLPKNTLWASTSVCLNFLSILHEKTYFFLHIHFYKTPTSFYLFYTFIQ